MSERTVHIKEQDARYLQHGEAIAPREYKQTEVGVIPEEWNVFPLRALCTEIVDGTHFTPMYVPDGIPFYSVENVTANDFDNVKYISRSEHDALSRRCRPERGDILLTRIGSLGETKLLDWEVDASIYVSLALLKVRPDVDSRYLYYYTKARQFVHDVENRSLINASPKKINVGDIGSVPIPVPFDRSEQGAIAEALSDVDGLLRALEALIAKKRAIRQAAMQQLLTGKTRLPGFSGLWRTRQLNEITKIPVTDGPHLTPEFLADGVPFLSVNNLADNRVNIAELRYISHADDQEFSKKCKPEKWDILLGKAASVGKVAIVDFDWHFNIWSPIALIRLGDQAVPRYAYYSLQSSHAIKQIEYFTNSSSQGNIGMTDIGKLQLLLPTVDEQHAIAKVLLDMDAEIAALEARRDKARAIKQGMMQELLTGITRLV